MAKILNEVSTEQMENLINKLLNYAITFDNEYKSKDIKTDFESGQHLAYYTLLDSMKNQLEVDGVELDVDLNKLIEDLL